MNKRPTITILIVLISIAITFMAPLFDTSIYLVNGHPTNWMSFIPSSPFRHMGLGFITSPFIHLGLEHLAVNIFFFIPIAMMIERKKSKGYLAFIFFAIHIQVLLALILIDHFYPLGAKGFLGSSHIIIGLYSFWFIKNKSYGLLFLTLVLISVGLWESQSPLTNLVHALGFVIGITSLFLGKLLIILGLKRSN